MKKILATDNDWNRAIQILHRYKQNNFFEVYKQNTFRQSITHRFLLTDLDTFDDYLQLLEDSDVEKDILYELLIPTKSQFFLNPEAWQSLKQIVIPQLMAIEPNKEISCWVAGCGTGEEAYSLAILLDETILARDDRRKVKIIATDIDTTALKTSVKGVYNHRAVNVLGKERLEQYFIKRDNSFLVNHELRSIISFAPHNLIRPIGFTDIDLICCRNTLIYFNPQYRNKALLSLTNSLVPQGFLFLGNNELLEESENFSPLDVPGMIFQKGAKSKNSSVKNNRIFSNVTINKFQLQYSKIDSAIYKLRDLKSELELTQINLQSSAAALRSADAKRLNCSEGKIWGDRPASIVSEEDWKDNAFRADYFSKGRPEKVAGLRFSQKLQQESEIVEEVNREVVTANTNISKINQELYSINQARSLQIEVLERLNSDLENLLRSIDIGVIFLDRQLKIHKYNSSAQKIINFRATDIGRPIKDLEHNLDCSNLIEILEQFLETKCPKKLEIRNNQTKEILLMKLHYYSVDSQIENNLSLGQPSTSTSASNRIDSYSSKSSAPVYQGVILTFIDISDRKQAEATLSYQAFYDSLTGLPNRLLFKEKLQHALNRLSRQKSLLLAVLYLDLNGFKEVNDSLGHSAGDLLLVEVAQRLKEVIRSNDVASRLGGDEFAILLEEIYSPEQCLEIASRIHFSLARRFSIESRQITISTSIGVAIHSQEDSLSNGIETLIENADMGNVFSQTKRCGRN